MSVQVVIAYVILTLLGALLLYHRWSRRKILATVANMHGPPALPLIGHLHLLLKLTSEEPPLQTFMKLANFPSPSVFLVGPMVHVCVSSPEHAQLVLNSPLCYDKPIQYGFFRVNGGLLTSPGYIWKSQRKYLNLSFGSAILNGFAGIFNEKSSILNEVFAKLVGKPERDVTHEISKGFLDTIFSTSFGINFDLQRTPQGDHLCQIQNDAIDAVTKRIFSPWCYFDPLYRLTRNYKKERNVMQSLRDLSASVMDAKKCDDTPPIGRKKSIDELMGKKPQIFLDAIMNLAVKTEGITRDDIIDHILTVIIAGNDTTATTFCNMIQILAIHQDVQERVYQEIMQVCPGKDRFVTIEDAAKLTYAEMVCKETMRLFPIGPVVGRVSTEDIRLDDDYTIPKSSTIIVGIFQLHRDPTIWGPEPEKFNPDHFLPDNVSQRHPYAYLPFSGGPRNCIGMRYAWISMKIMLAYVLRRYRLRTSLSMDTIKMKDSIIAKMSGCFITLEER